MKKKLFLLSIILFPSLIYLFFEMTHANFKKMVYFGPRTLNSKGDTVYYSVPQINFITGYKYFRDSVKVTDGKTTKTIVKDSIDQKILQSIDTSTFSCYVILFLNNKLRNEGYKLNGIIDYINYKPEKIKDVPVFVVSDLASAGNKETKNELRGDFDSLKVNLPNFHPLLIDYKESQELFLAKTYFKQKPVYVFDYFAVLVDKGRHIRGYYDPTFNAEITRMIADYKHLKIRDEYAETEKQNDIKKN